jgi:hypothetical protein
MSCHYWAPTDYLSPDNLKIPSELAYQANPTDPIDLLFFKINSSYPWEIHAPRRWYNNPCEYKYETHPNMCYLVHFLGRAFFNISKAF